MSFLKTLVVWEVMGTVIMTLLSVIVNDISAWYTLRLMVCGFLLLDIVALVAAHIVECYGSKGNTSFFQYVIRKWNDD